MPHWFHLGPANKVRPLKSNLNTLYSGTLTATFRQNHCQLSYFSLGTTGYCWFFVANILSKDVTAPLFCFPF